MKNLTGLKSAFTLAEVLITLGVIGVVAAMTIPTILNKYQEHVIIQKFKKVYSLLNNAVLLQYANNGAYYKCQYTDGSNGTAGTSEECYSMYEDMKRILKTSKICTGHAFNNGCIPNYKGVDTVQHEQNFKPDDLDFMIKNCGGFSENNIKNNDPAWVLNDGTIILFYTDMYFKAIAVDVNGAQGPNKWGYDLFYLVLYDTNGSRKYLSGGCMLVEKGGIGYQIFKKAGVK